MLLTIAIFLVTSMVPVVSMVPADTAGSREQDDDAYQTKNEFHMFFLFCDFLRAPLVRCNRFCLANGVPTDPSCPRALTVNEL